MQVPYGWDTPHEVQGWKVHVAYYRITADESGKLNSKAEYTSFCGYVGLSAEWNRFEMEWLSCLFKWQVPPIHMAKIYRPEGDKEWAAVRDKWGARWEHDRVKMLEEFGMIIHNSQLITVGGVVDAEHFRSMPDSLYKRAVKNPMFLSEQTLIMESIGHTRFAPQTMSLVIDDDREFAMECYEWLGILKDTFPEVKERMVGICFGNDKAYPGLQAADMIAYEARKLMVESKANPDAEPSLLFGLLTHAGRTQPKLINAAQLDEFNAGMP